jgi:hypothetical protein
MRSSTGDIHIPWTYSERVDVRFDHGRTVLRRQQDRAQEFEPFVVADGFDKMMIETRSLTLAPIFVLTVARNRDDLGVPASILLPVPLGDVEAAGGF